MICRIIMIMTITIIALIQSKWPIFGKTFATLSMKV